MGLPVRRATSFAIRAKKGNRPFGVELAFGEATNRLGDEVMQPGPTPFAVLSRLSAARTLLQRTLILAAAFHHGWTVVVASLLAFRKDIAEPMG